MKKILALLALILILGFAGAESFSSKQVGDTFLQLESNSDECLTFCEAWLYWDLDEKLTDVKIPASNDADFSIEFVKKTAASEDLTDFGVDVYSYDLVEKDWVYTAPFFGFNAKAGELYKIHVWGRRKAQLGSEGIDWIPTLFGEEIGKWAWWNVNWRFKQTITLRTNDINISADITDDHVILVDFNSEQLRFWDNVDAEAEDIRFLNADENSLLDFNLQKFDTTTERMLAWVRVTDTFTFNAVTTFFIYYGNGAATSTEDGAATWTDFEAVFHADEGTGATVGDRTGNFDANASSSSIWDSNSFLGDSSLGCDATYSATQTTLLDTMPSALSISLWFKVDPFDLNSTSATQYLTRKVNLPGDFYNFLFSNGKLSAALFPGAGGGSTLAADGADWTAGKWNFAAFSWNTSDGTKIFINEDINNSDSSNTNFMANGSDEDWIVCGQKPGVTIFAGIIDEIKIYSSDLNTDEARLIYASESRTLQQYEQPERVPSDVNIVAIDGFGPAGPFPSFGSIADGNLTIDFNVFDFNNLRMSIDINFSDQNTQGTGTVMVNDLNLDADVCEDVNFQNSTRCSWDVNIDRSFISDNNYYVLVSGTTSERVNFTVTTDLLRIQNNALLIVSIPIDEVTENPIDTGISSFTVRILEETTLRTFAGHTDENSFIIETSADTVFVEVDTNTSAIYYSRTYAFVFSSPGDVLLQPFLPPVSDSILTTVTTVSGITLDPLPGHRLRVFKNTGGGRTLMHDSTTDSKGEAVIPFVIADSYQIEVFTDANVFIETLDYIASSTTNDYFIYIGDTGPGIIEPDKPREINVFWSPAIRVQNDADFNVTAKINSPTGSISTIQFFVTNNDVNLFDSGADTPPTSDGNTYTFNPNNFSAADLNFPLFFTVIVVRDDGKEFFFRETYTVRPAADEDSTLWLLTVGMRRNFGCSDDLTITCDPLMFVAFFILIFSLGALAVGATRNGAGLTIIGVAIVAWFTYIAWIPFWLGVFIAFIAVVVIAAKAKFD